MVRSRYSLFSPPWETNGLRTMQTAFVTELNGAKPDGGAPAADTSVVFLAKMLGDVKALL